MDKDRQLMPYGVYETLFLLELAQDLVNVLPGFVDVFSCLGACKHDLSRNENEQNYFSVRKSHSIDESSEQFRVVAGIRFVRRVVEGLQLDRESDVAICYHVLNFEFLSTNANEATATRSHG